MPTTLRLVLAVLLLLAGAVLVVLAVLGASGRLPRNRFVGVRTPSSLRTADAFALANRVAARPLGAAGLIGLVGGTALLLTDRGGAAPWVLAVIALAGVVVMAGLGGSFGARAAEIAIAEQAPAPSCAGVCTGCDLVAGCGGPAESDRRAGERSAGTGR
ncbi:MULTISPECIES: SdpI family protein [Pseudonocardia]|uniref:SdpI family protein n=1 Tax=Pseudonocardia TaxID=1847 RepID=UPI0031D581FA